jgi:signal transduction histidine kinase/uncharacterized protein YhfF
MTLLNQVALAISGEVGDAYLLALAEELAQNMGAEACLVCDEDNEVVARWPVVQEPNLDAVAALTIGPIVLVGAQRDLEPPEREQLEILAKRAALELERRRHDRALARLVEAADEERRRIGRDLHDSVQQRLIVLGQRRDLARRALASGDTERADEMVAEARAHAADAGTELRDMARGLFPVGLSERGLEGALRLLARRSPLPMHLDALPARRLPDAVELTVYYLVSEALANAVQHAEATEMHVEIVQRGPSLHAEVSDDGVGGADADAGTGLRGLGDRVTALSGRLEIDSPAGGGTRLHATIPLAPWRDARDPFLEFGHEGDGGAGERRIAEVLSGTRTATVSLAREWELEGGPPRIGQRLPVLDHRGNRRGAVVVTRVSVLPFGDIDDTVMEAENTGEASVVEWRRAYSEFYEGCREEIATLIGEPGWQLTDEEPMVVTFFRVSENGS